MKLQPSLVDVLRSVTGKICELLYAFNTDPKEVRKPWHYFTGSPFGFRWESRKKREQRLLSYIGEDDETLRIEEKHAGAREMIERAKVNKARRAVNDGPEE